MAIDTDARRVVFRTRLLGFDKEEVRAFVSNLVSEYEQAREQIDALARPANGGAASKQSAVQQSEAALLVERTLASAHRVADDIRKTAEQEAEHLVADAKLRATRLVDTAVGEASEKREAAVARLRELESDIEQMQMRHREVKATLESLMLALGEALTEARAQSVFDEGAERVGMRSVTVAATTAS